jgi:hypothetical protein
MGRRWAFQGPNSRHPAFGHPPYHLASAVGEPTAEAEWGRGQGEGAPPVNGTDPENPVVVSRCTLEGLANLLTQVNAYDCT